MNQRAVVVGVPLIGCQLLWLGPLWLGVIILLVAVWRGWRLGWRWLVLGCVLGLVSGGVEAMRTRNPTVPTGVIVVQPTSWRAGSDHYYNFSGQSSNGVYVTGGGTVDDEAGRKIDNATRPLTVTCSEPAERITGPRNLYEFDYRDFAWAQYHQAYRFPGQKLRVAVRNSKSVVDWLYGVRNRLLMRMDRLPSKMNTYARALILGLMDGQMTDMRDVFSRLGIIHLFSVSGLHIFALVGMLYWLTDRLRVPREWVDWSLLVLLPMLLVIIPPGAGIVRSVWMRFLQVLNDRWSWHLTTLDVFCAVLAANLLWQPRVLTTLGGQLTYLLTFFLVVQPMRGRWRSALTMAGVSMPPLLVAMYGVHPLTFAFNCVLMPVFERVLMPVLIVAVCWPGCPLWPACNVMLTGFESGLIWLGQLPGYWHFGALPWVAGLILLWLILRAVVRRRWHTPILVTLIMYMWVNIHPQWRVTIIDVGQGDSILIEAPWKQATVLIDTGGRAFGETSSPPAKRVTLNYLAARGITHLDMLVLTHPDADHVGDAAVITKGIAVRQIVTTPTAAGAKLITGAQVAGRPRIRTVMAGSRLKVGPLRLDVVAPNHETEYSNSNSVVLYGKIGDSNWLLTGDADQQVETEQLQPQNLAVDFLKVGHHGSKTSSNPAFIAAIHPQWGVASAGVNNRYGHPHAETVATFNNLGIPFLVTSQTGMIWVDSSGQSHSVHTFLH